VDHDASIEIAVTIGRGAIPVVHLHAARRSIWRRGEVGVVRAGAILRFGVDEVVAFTALAAVV
jgi:hypothetical protein